MDEKADFPADNASESVARSWPACLLLTLVFLASAFLLFKLLRKNQQSQTSQQQKFLPKMKRQDFTVEQLRKYDGKGGNPDDPERVLVAVDNVVFDMSTNGRRFYGPGGPYSLFAGRDASRALATFSLTAEQFRDEYDHLSDLKSSQLEQIRDWAQQYRGKYDVVGRLLKPGEEPKIYEDEQEEEEQAEEKSQSTEAKKSN